MSIESLTSAHSKYLDENYRADDQADVRNPHVWSRRIGNPLEGPSLSQVAYDNFINLTPGFEEALHVSANALWTECSIKPVFVGGKGHNEDITPAPANSPFFGHAIDRVVNQGGRVLLIAGEKDMLVTAISTTLGMQNVTWQDKQGFQVAPHQEIKVRGRRVGIIQSERGVTYSVLDKSGHMAPANEPEASEKLVKYLLGQLEYKDLLK